MKKLFLTCTALVFLASPVYAEDIAGEAGAHEGRKGGMMQKIDTDGDGKVSKSEFIAVHEKKFSKIDADGDGYVGREEMKAHKQTMRAKKSEMREKWKNKKQDRGGFQGGFGGEE